MVLRKQRESQLINQRQRINLRKRIKKVIKRLQSHPKRKKRMTRADQMALKKKMQLMLMLILSLRMLRGKRLSDVISV
jgi:hypothetical protein